MALSPRQERFVQEYCVRLEAKAAAEAAGYSAKWSKSIGSRLLGRPVVAAAIREAGIKHSGIVGVKIETVLHELQLIAYRGTEKTSDRLKALELLGRHCGAFTEESVKVVGITLEDLVPRRRAARPPDPAPSPATPVAAAPSTPPAAAAPPTPAPPPTQAPAQAAPAPAPVAVDCVHAFPPSGFGDCLLCHRVWRPSALPSASGNGQPKFAEGVYDPWKHLRGGKPSA